MNGRVGSFKIESTAVKWLGALPLDAFRKFDSGAAEDFMAQIVAEVAAAQ